jgi:hypothetical protein
VNDANLFTNAQAPAISGIFSKRAFSTLRILPLSGKIA